MVRVYFMRKDGRQKRGYIADIPTNAPCSYVDPFIICQTDETKLNPSMLNDNTIRLDLNKLMAKYPNTNEEYVDENGDAQTRINYGYFSEQGRSVVEGCPIITLSDIFRGN